MNGMMNAMNGVRAAVMSSRYRGSACGMRMVPGG
jgi:hypothetical protein